MFLELSNTECVSGYSPKHELGPGNPGAARHRDSLAWQYFRSIIVTKLCTVDTLKICDKEKYISCIGFCIPVCVVNYFSFNIKYNFSKPLLSHSILIIVTNTLVEEGELSQQWPALC